MTALKVDGRGAALKKYLCFFISLLFLLQIVNVTADPIAEELQVKAVNYNIVINNTKAKLINSIVNINDSTYIPLRELSELFRIEVLWDGEEQAVEVNSDIRIIPSKRDMRE